MRAIVDDPDLLDLTGTPSVGIRRCSWIIGSMFACLNGVLFAPLLPEIDDVTFTLLATTAFGSAAIDAFTSLP